MTAVLVDGDGNATTVWSTTNSSNSDRQNVNVSLAGLAGKSGRLTISYSHSGSYYVGDQYGGRLYAPTVTSVQVATPPAVAWDTETLTALGMPEIRSVSSVSEGFYRECGLGTTTFYVECSESVTGLAARPSHLSLVGDGDVSVTPNGNGRFTVRVSPSGVTAANARSRMILTLVATDSNGTTAYKDLSLRFAPVDSSAVTVTATTSSGDSFTVDVPYEWIDEYSLVPSGSSASAYEGALAGDADADGDGCPNWAEYVCGSSPIDPSSKLIATIRIENGQPIIGYESPHGIAAGFKAVVKGTNDLTEDFSLWQVTTGTTSLHYFRVEIVPE